MCRLADFMRIALDLLRKTLAGFVAGVCIWLSCCSMIELQIQLFCLTDNDKLEKNQISKTRQKEANESFRASKLNCISLFEIDRHHKGEKETVDKPAKSLGWISSFKVCRPSTEVEKVPECSKTANNTIIMSTSILSTDNHLRR